jgi:hypothetical protein
VINRHFGGISEEFYELTERAAKAVGRRWPTIDWEDIRQAIWLYILDKKIDLSEWEAEGEEVMRKLCRVGGQYASSQAEKDVASAGGYRYRAKEVRGMLKAGFLTDSNAGTLAEYHDLETAMKRLKQSHSHYFKAVVDKYVQDDDTVDSNLVTRSVTKLTFHMNNNRNREILLRSGVSNRRSLTNN